MVPPVYVWVGCAKAIGQRHSNKSYRSIDVLFHRQQSDMGMDKDNAPVHDLADKSYSYYSRIALTQSAMETGHSWHMFAVKEELKQPSSPETKMVHRHANHHVERDISYKYIGSSNASRGRPSTRIMNDVFEEFCESVN